MIKLMKFYAKQFYQKQKKTECYTKVKSLPELFVVVDYIELNLSNNQVWYQSNHW